MNVRLIALYAVCESYTHPYVLIPCIATLLSQWCHSSDVPSTACKQAVDRFDIRTCAKRYHHEGSWIMAHLGYTATLIKMHILIVLWMCRVRVAVEAT
ncbi:hypothetical protein GGR53DRAFT_516550 [Hypoxylon sp. FL1150]|nr:hypothetical protein GGR53DRAFT_516550 [Hypoxylon sp. FL1150]